jgi:hypothetical protein
MSYDQENSFPNNPYPRDVTSPGPYQRPGAARAEKATAQGQDSRRSTPMENGDNPSSPTEQPPPEK